MEVVSIPGRLDRSDELALFEFGFPLDLGAEVPVEERRDLDDERWYGERLVGPVMIFGSQGGWSDSIKLKNK